MGRGAKPGHDFLGNQYTGGIPRKNIKNGQSQGQVERVIAAALISAATWGIKKGLETYNKVKNNL